MRNAVQWLLVTAVAFEGLRAGAGTFRMLIDLPARGAIGPVAFAAFSRATDLSAVGVPFYIVYGVGGALLTLATWAAALRAGARRELVALTGLSALCSAAILVLTTQAAPLMFAVCNSPDDPQRLSQLLDAFTIWTNWRIGLADLSFVCVLIALARWRGAGEGQRS